MPSELEPLRGECKRISTVTIALSEEDFAKPTRLPAWNVKQLLAHMYRAVDRLNTGLDSFPPAEVDHDSISYWRSYDPKADADELAERAKETAAEYETGHELAEAWDEMWHRAIQRATLEDGRRTFPTWGPILRLDEFLKTRTLEITVHGMDMADALGHRPWCTPEGLEVTTAILSGLLGTSPPRDLGWDDVTFIEKGTGRRPLEPRDRDSLGDLVERFPLIG